MKLKKIAATVVMTTTIATMATAQTGHEFSIGVGGGLASLMHKPQIDLYLGGVAGLGYTYFFNEHWGIGTGVEVSQYKGKFNLQYFDESYNAYDGYNNFKYNYELFDFIETQQAVLVNIPLMMRYVSGMFYFSVGGKAGIPLNARFENSAARIVASGYYDEFNLILHDPMFMGFGEFKNQRNRSKFDMKTVFSASLEFGFRWRLGHKKILYTGIYADYGITDGKPDGAVKLIPYNASNNYYPNSVVAAAANGKTLTDKLSPFAAGLKLSIAFGNDLEPKAARAAEEAIAKPGKKATNRW
ncbi:MAG: PorT family protein [Prevotellaceae bacterium]|jgi:hypothetical protein|nr:PorT family protein [Prevotellaceae bacterium]